MKKKYLVFMLAVMILAGTFVGGYTYGLNIYQKTMDAIGFLTISDEAKIVEVEVDNANALKVKVESVATTQPGVLYIIHLILDGTEFTQQTVSWTALEIPGTKKVVSFTGLNLVPVLTVKLEITH